MIIIMNILAANDLIRSFVDFISDLKHVEAWKNGHEYANNILKCIFFKLKIKVICLKFQWVLF